MPSPSAVLRDLITLTVAAFIVRTVAAWLVPFPPHVDSAYYTMVAEQLATGHGFTAPALWSFLEVGGRLPSEPSLPVPSNGHWMPMTAIVSAGSMSLFGADWRAGQVPMVLLSVLLVPLTYLVACHLWPERRVAFLSAVLMIAAGPLLLMYPLVESFAVFGVFGAAALYASMRAVDSPRPGPWLVLAGVLAALASLTRIDGTILALAPATAWLLRRPLARDSVFGSPVRAVAWGTASAIAFLLVVSPWLIRDSAVFGTPFPTPGGRMLWIRDYNEHLSISLDLTLQRYLDWGLLPIVGSKLSAAVTVAGRTLALLGGIFGLYLFAGLWLHRSDRRLLPFLVYISAMFLTMVLFFTEHAPKGAFLHSAPAWLPFAMPIGVVSVAPASSALGRLWPFLRRTSTHRFLEIVAVFGAIMLAVVGGMGLLGQWEVRHARHEAAAAFLNQRASSDDVLLAADPSSLYLLTGLRGVATSFDPYPVVDQVIRGYGVDWVVVVLEPGASLDPLGLWQGSSAIDADGTQATFLSDEPAFEADGVRVFEVRGSGG